MLLLFTNEIGVAKMAKNLLVVQLDDFVGILQLLQQLDFVQDELLVAHVIDLHFLHRHTLGILERDAVIDLAEATLANFAHHRIPRLVHFKKLQFRYQRLVSFEILNLVNEKI